MSTPCMKPQLIEAKQIFVLMTLLCGFKRRIEREKFKTLLTTLHSRRLDGKWSATAHLLQSKALLPQRHGRKEIKSKNRPEFINQWQDVLSRTVRLVFRVPEVINVRMFFTKKSFRNFFCACTSLKCINKNSSQWLTIIDTRKRFHGKFAIFFSSKHSNLHWWCHHPQLSFAWRNVLWATNNY